MIYNKEYDDARSAGKSKTNAEAGAAGVAKKLPEFTAVQKWLDTEAEIRLKKAIVNMANELKIPALIIRSINLKQISALSALGLNISQDAEIAIQGVFF